MKRLQIKKLAASTIVAAAMFAATAAGVYPRVEEAMAAMGQGFDVVYKANARVTQVYAKQFERYKKLGQFINSGI